MFLYFLKRELTPVTPLHLVYLKESNTATTTYANKFYSVSSATTTKHIITPSGLLVATVEHTSDSGGGGIPGDTGFKTTGTVEVNTGWGNMTTTRINTSNNSDAACSATCDNTDDAQLSDYSFGIPSGATINGIEVVAEMAEGGSADNIPVGFSLSWNDGLSWTSVKTATVDGTTDTDYTLGDSSDTWGRSWIDTEFADGTFRMRLDKNPTVDNLLVDYLRLKVFYTTGGGESSTTTVAYIHPDHLGGTNAITDDVEELVQTLDYYPYGTKRIESGQDLSQREFIGEIFDENTSLSYLNVRYYSGDRGQFLSQDKTFLAIGDPTKVRAITGLQQEAVLSDPQFLHSYSYARNNPIVNKDPEGNFAVAAVPYAVITAPQLIPWLVGGAVGLISTLYLADQIDWDNLQTGTLQNSRPYEHMLYPTPQDPNNLKPPHDDLPSWQKWLYHGLGIGATGYEFYDQYKKHEGGIRNFLNRSNPNSSGVPQSFGGSVQQRYNTVQNYNASADATTPQSQLSTTPSGAVVDWGGNLIE